MTTYTPESTKGIEVRVFLDGVEVHDCFTANTDAGFIEQYLRDASGNLIMNRDEPASIKEYGKVTVMRGGAGPDK